MGGGSTNTFFDTDKGTQTIYKDNGTEHSSKPIIQN